MANIPTKDEELKLSRTQLGEIYPKPKTYEDRLEERTAREARRLKRIPKHIALFAALRLFIIVAISALVYTAAPMMVAMNVVSGAFNIVLCVLALLAIIKWQAAEISSAFDKKGLNDATFFILYGTIIAPLSALTLYKINTQQSIPVSILMYGAAFLLHLACINLIVQLMNRAQRKQ